MKKNKVPHISTFFSSSKSIKVHSREEKLKIQYISIQHILFSRLQSFQQFEIFKHLEAVQHTVVLWLMLSNSLSVVECFAIQLPANIWLISNHSLVSIMFALSCLSVLMYSMYSVQHWLGMRCYYSCIHTRCLTTFCLVKYHHDQMKGNRDHS